MDMKLILTLTAIIVVTGCTTLKPVELSPEQLHDRIYAGEVIHEGDSVKIITSDGKHHRFKVTAITDQSVVGKEIQLPIVDIVAVETKEFSGGKTAALAGGSYIVLAAIIIVGLGASL